LLVSTLKTDSIDSTATFINSMDFSATYFYSMKFSTTFLDSIESMDTSGFPWIP
jgi:hypothetical protein